MSGGGVGEVRVQRESPAATLQLFMSSTVAIAVGAAQEETRGEGGTRLARRMVEPSSQSEGSVSRMRAPRKATPPLTCGLMSDLPEEKRAASPPRPLRLRFCAAGTHTLAI